MATPSTILITGANRGIGRGYVTKFLAKPSTTVIAAVRDPSHVSSQDLSTLPKASDSRLIVVKLDSSKLSDPVDAVSQLKEKYGINSLDIVIANAGIANDGTSVRKTSAESIIQHININAIAPIALFQATADLLQSSKTGNPIFVATSTLIGSIGSMDALAGFPATGSPYGGSKAALNWFLRRLHYEEPWLTSFVFHPGVVNTDLAIAAVEGSGLKMSDLGAISVDTSVSGMVKTIEKATRDISGTFQNYDGTTVPW